MHPNKLLNTNKYRDANIPLELSIAKTATNIASRTYKTTSNKKISEYKYKCNYPLAHTLNVLGSLL